jgi:hydroxymethylpyrimidine pyrophosphatase-like HAD family hydrolase
MILKNKYTQRLFEEWKMYNSIIIGVDFDDTIYPYRKNFTDYSRVINLLRECQSTGATLIIYTGSAVDRYDEILSYCNQKGLKIAKINENIITPFGDNRKIYANIYLDDRSGLEESLSILESALYQYRAHLQNNKNYLHDVG